jgi:hypothetical protein
LSAPAQEESDDPNKHSQWDSLLHDLQHVNVSKKGKIEVRKIAANPSANPPRFRASLKVFSS